MEVTMKKVCYLTVAAMAVLGLVVSPATAKSYKGSKKAWLGVYTQTVDQKLVEAFDLSVKYGAFVNEVVEDSPADEAGLEEDDVIISFDGSKITNSDELAKAISEHHPGDEVILTVVREGDEVELKVTLEKRSGYDKSIWITQNPNNWDYHYSFDYNDDNQPYIGVSLLDLTSQLGDYFGVDKGRGALITEVLKDSPAEKAELKAGDVIVSIDGDEVFDSKDIRDLISEKEPGDKVEVTVIRDKKERKLSVEVAEAEKESDAYSHIFLQQLHGPDIDIMAPKMKAKAKLRALQSIPPLPVLDPDDFPDLDPDDFDELQQEMKKLKKELKSLHKEMEELREKLK
jgi:predicted metalloprotease with PDZ domain